VTRLDPYLLFERIFRDVPADLHQHLFVTGSLAAAYHFRAALEGRAVNTKDADLIIHPAGQIESCRTMALRLLGSGWRRIKGCHASPREPVKDLRVIRLYPPESHDYFIEFLSLPEKDQKEPKLYIPIELDDGWYGLPSFRFMILTSLNRLRSDVGLEFASPAMMALSNLLSHPHVGTQRMESEGSMQGLLRSAKDLGRVLALAFLSERSATKEWLEQFRSALNECFPNDWKQLAAQSGMGLKELLSDDGALREAHITTEIGLLNGRSVTVENLRATANRLLHDVIDPLTEMAKEK
jgi:hypothetical protein